MSRIDPTPIALITIRENTECNNFYGYVFDNLVGSYFVSSTNTWASWKPLPISIPKLSQGQPMVILDRQCYDTVGNIVVATYDSVVGTDTISSMLVGHVGTVGIGGNVTSYFPVLRRYSTRSASAWMCPSMRDAFPSHSSSASMSLDLN